MGNFDVKFAAYERAIKQNPAWENMSKAERAEQMGRYAEGLQQAEIKATKKAEGRMYARMLAQENSSIWGTKGNPAVIVDNLFPDVSLSQPKSNNEVKISGKWVKGKACFLVDANGNCYKVDKKTYKAAKRGKNIQLSVKDKVEFDQLPKEAKNQFRKFLPETSDVTTTVSKNPNPAHPSNATLGTAHATPSSGSKSISVNKVYNPITKMYDVKVGNKTVKSFYREGLADKYIQKNSTKLLRDLAPLGNIAPHPNPAHPSNATLGTAHATPSSGMTRQQFAQQRGTTYTPPVSGVAEADRRAAEIIKQNAANVDDTAGKVVQQNADKVDDTVGKAIQQNADKVDDTVGKVIQQNADKVDDTMGKAIQQNADKVDDIAKNFNWKKFGKWGAIAAAAVTVGAILYKECNNKNNASTTEEVNKPDSTDKNTSATNTTPAQQPTIAPATTADTTATDTTQVQQTATAPATTATQEEAVTEVDSTQSSDKTTVSDSPIDADGMMVAQKGDGFWQLAERYLEYVDKGFAELPEDKRIAKIDAKKIEFIGLYREQLINEVIEKSKKAGKELTYEEAAKKINVKIEEMEINGKLQKVVVPIIHPGQKIQVVKKMDVAA